MIRIGICDDDPAIIAEIIRLIHKLDNLEYHISTFTSSIELQEYMRRKACLDLVFMDIMLRQDNGIEAAKDLQQEFPGVQIIFMTGYIDLAGDIFDADPVYFLVKPVTEEKLTVALNRAVLKLQQAKKEVFSLTLKDGIYQVAVNEISYLESASRVVTMHTAKEQYQYYKKLDEAEQELGDQFVRCHQSYLVNMEKIKELKRESIQLFDGTVIPVSRNNRIQTKEKFLHFLGDTL